MNDAMFGWNISLLGGRLRLSLEFPVLCSPQSLSHTTSTILSLGRDNCLPSQMSGITGMSSASDPLKTVINLHFSSWAGWLIGCPKERRPVVVYLGHRSGSLFQFAVPIKKQGGVLISKRFGVVPEDYTAVFPWLTIIELLLARLPNWGSRPFGACFPQNNQLFFSAFRF